MGSRAQGFWHGAETILGVLASFILSLSVPVLAFVAVLAGLVNGEFALAGYAAGVFVVGTTASVVLIRTVGETMQRLFPGWNGERTPAVPLPRAVFLATRALHGRLLGSLRLLLAVWWLAHFGSGVLVALAAAGYAKIAFPPGSAAQVVVPQLLGFGFTFAANVYVLLAVALLTPASPGETVVALATLLALAVLLVSVVLQVLAW